MLENDKKSFKKIKSRSKTIMASISCFLLCAPFAFADLKGLAGQVNQEITSTSKSIMSVLNTLVATIGIVYVIIIGFLFLFKHEAFKENSKALIIGLVSIGALYGLTELGMGGSLKP